MDRELINTGGFEMSKLTWLFCGMVCLASVPAPAADLFWNPFASGKDKSNSEKIITPADQEGSTHLSMPDFNLVPKLPKPQLDLMEPVEKVNEGTKHLWDKTKQVLTPPKLTPPNVDLLSPFRGKPAKPQARDDNKSMFSSWFRSEPEPPRPMTVSDFIGMERPE
jgi:hypothetical protein